jgi:hypothetical protein
MRQQIAAALDRYAVPHGGNRVLEPGRAINSSCRKRRIKVEGRDDALEAFADRLEQAAAAVPVKGRRARAGARMDASDDQRANFNAPEALRRHPATPSHRPPSSRLPFPRPLVERHRQSSQGQGAREKDVLCPALSGEVTGRMDHHPHR